MHEAADMFAELPYAFQESALVDRFHGFIRGWDIPRMRESMKARGWALNVEYFSEVMHSLRGEVGYPALVDDLLEVLKSADTRDTTAIKRICSGFVKLLLPHMQTVSDVNRDEFQAYCLAPAIRMRGLIRRQLHRMDQEYSDALPDIKVRQA